VQFLNLQTIHNKLRYHLLNFRNPVLSINALISKEIFLNLEVVNDFIQRPVLRLRGRLLGFNENEYNITFDTDDYFAADALVCLPVILCKLQIQRIVLRAKEERQECYESVGFFFNDHSKYSKQSFRQVQGLNPS
jgi:hypothetical protein